MTGFPSFFRDRQPRELPAGMDPSGHEAHTVREWRPLLRRALSTLRPLRVRIRARKPWVLARLRLLGWYVRFTRNLFSTLCRRATARLLEPALTH